MVGGRQLLLLAKPPEGCRPTLENLEIFVLLKHKLRSQHFSRMFPIGTLLGKYAVAKEREHDLSPWAHAPVLEIRAQNGF